LTLGSLLLLLLLLQRQRRRLHGLQVPRLLPVSHSQLLLCASRSLQRGLWSLRQLLLLLLVQGWLLALLGASLLLLLLLGELLCSLLLFGLLGGC